MGVLILKTEVSPYTPYVVEKSQTFENMNYK